MGERREGNYRWDVIYKESILKMTQMGLVLTSFGQFSRYTTDDHIIFLLIQYITTRLSLKSYFTLLEGRSLNDSILLNSWRL